MQPRSPLTGQNKNMIKESWDYDRHSHKVILNVGPDRYSRRRRREIRITSNLLNRPRLVVLIAIIAILIALFLKEAKSVLAYNPQFIIQDIILENTGLIDKNILASILKTETKMGLFSISTNKIVKILEKDPDIEGVTVEKVLPGTLKIKIKERVPYIALHIEGEEHLIDNSGVVLLRKRGDWPVPVIYGLKIKKLIPGESCIVPELENILNILRIGDSIGWGKFIEIRKIDVHNEDYISIYAKERILVKFKMDNICDRLNKLMVVLNDVQRKGKLVKIVDLRFKDVYVE